HRSRLLREGRPGEPDRLRGQRHRPGAHHRQREARLQRRPRELRDRQLTLHLPGGADSIGFAGTRARRPLTMNIADLTNLTPRQLDQRAGGGLEITLYWHPEDNGTSVDVYHPATEATINFPLPAGQAL